MASLRRAGNDKLWAMIGEIARGLAILHNTDTLGGAYEYLIGQFVADSGKRAGESCTSRRIGAIFQAIVATQPVVQPNAS